MLIIKYIIAFFAFSLIACLLIFCQPKAAAEEEQAIEESVIQNYLPINNSWPTKEEIKTYIREEAIKHNININTALRIANCESGYNRTAKNPNSSARGVFQIINGTQKYIERETGKEYNIFNPYDNVDMAIWLLGKQGTSPWNASKGCWIN